MFPLVWQTDILADDFRKKTIWRSVAVEPQSMGILGTILFSGSGMTNVKKRDFD